MRIAKATVLAMAYCSKAYPRQTSVVRKGRIQPRRLVPARAPRGSHSNVGLLHRLADRGSIFSLAAIEDQPVIAQHSSQFEVATQTMVEKNDTIFADLPSIEKINIVFAGDLICT